ncbi:MAG: hypothetical protein ABSC62_08450, partial [Terracidiphilus sp.]
MKLHNKENVVNENVVIDNRQENGGQMTIKRNIVLLISLLSLGVGMALAQIESSTITGTVTD